MKISEEQLIQDRVIDLRENTDFTSALFESLVGYAIIAADFGGNIIAYNNGARQIYGYTPEEIIGKQNIEVFFPEDFIITGKLQQITADLMAKGQLSYEGEKVRKNGDTFPAQILFTLTRHKNGSVAGFVEIVEDLTQRKQTELSLRNIITSSIDGIVIVDQKGLIRFFNPSFGSLFGRKAEDLLGSMFGFPLVSGETTEIEIVRKRSEKTSIDTRTVEIRVVQINWEKENAYLALMQDITERKKVEEERSKLERMKTEFISNISHELRTPLQSIKGFAKLMLQGKVPDPETQKEFLTIIDSQSENLTRLIESLLDMSRIESCRFEIQKARLSVKDLIENAVGELYSLTNQRGIRIHENIPATLPEIKADGERLRQVMVNLFSNAIKFSHDGGSITVSADAKDNELLVQVTDYGIGISEDVMEHLFERFYQGNGSMTRSAGGSGLGLYISKQIIEAHGGDIWVESKVGGGSTFSFTLPYEKSHSEGAEQPRNPAQAKLREGEWSQGRNVKV